MTENRCCKYFPMSHFVNVPVPGGNVRPFHKRILCGSSVLVAFSGASAGLCLDAVDRPVETGLAEAAFAADQGGDGPTGQLQVINDPVDSWDQFRTHAERQCNILNNKEKCSRIQGLVARIQSNIVSTRERYPLCDPNTIKSLRTSLGVLENQKAPTPNALATYQANITNFSMNCAVGFSPAASGSAALTVQQQALSAVAVVVRKGVPQCSGLLTGAFFITARHCQPELAGADIVQASTGNRVRVDDTAVRMGTGNLQWVPEDFAVYRTRNTAEVALPNVHPAVISDPEAAFVVAARPFSAVPATGNLRDIMISQPSGFCHAMVNAEELCLEMQCPTLPSYSGAPVFRLDSGGKNLEVLGLVSGASGTNSRCNKALVNATLVVPISRVGDVGKDGSANIAGTRR